MSVLVCGCGGTDTSQPESGKTESQRDETNNGEDAAVFVKGYALFFKDGKLVDYEDTYFTDDNSEIKPKDTISKQMTVYDEFDTIEFYLDGRK